MAVVRRSWLHPADRSGGAAATRDWSAAEPTSAADPGEVIEGGAPSWHRPRIPRLRWPVGVVLGLALAAGGTAVAWRVHSADDSPSPASLRALPPASSGLLGWAPRGQLAADDGFVRDALRTLQASGVADRPRTHLHLLYAGGSIVLVEGRDRNGHTALAQMVDGQVLVDRLLQREPVALTLPAGGRLRFLVPPATRGAPGPAVVWVQDPSMEATVGFRQLPADATGLTLEFEPAPGETRFVVFEPSVNEVGMPSGDRLEGDGVVVAGSLTPSVPAVRLTGSPWSVQGDPAPSRQWLGDAELLADELNVGGPVRVASLTGGGGFSPGPRPKARFYHDALYVVTDASGTDYVGYVLRDGDSALCSQVNRVPGHFADLLAVGGRCYLPAESTEAVSVTSRPDVRRAVIEFSGAAGRPAKRFALAPGAAEVLYGEPAESTVTLTAATDRSSATYVVPRG